MSSSYPSQRAEATRLDLCLAPFLQAPGLPFADVLSEAEIKEAFEAEGVSFGKLARTIFTPAITLWAFLSQIIHPDQLRACRAAVKRVRVLLQSQGREPCSSNTGDYCRARKKLPEGVLRRLALAVGNRLEARVPAEWLWFGRHVKVADGTAVSMPDSDANQKEYPQSTSQKPGLGFPLVRMVVLLSLATASCVGMALARFAGKRTGESTLLRQLFDLLNPGDIVLGDRQFGTYFLLALGLKRGVDWVARVHQARKIDLRRGRYLARKERLMTWKRPKRPPWMDEATYALVPETLQVRVILVEVHVPGFRVKELKLVTTLLDRQQYPTQAIAELYRSRWNVELDLRAIKQSMAMEPLRCQTPEMVRKEIWAHWLGYNLVRKTIAQAALKEGKLPRGISFSGARQTLASCWFQFSCNPGSVSDWADSHFADIARHRVGNRPNRVEPHAVKRRPKPHRLLQKPRKEARAELLRRRRSRAA